MPEIIVKIDGADAVRKRLSEIAGQSEYLSPIIQAIGEITRVSNERNFSAAGRPKWDRSVGAPGNPCGQSLPLGRLRTSFARQDIPLVKCR